MPTQHEDPSYDAIFQVEGYRRTFEQEQDPILHDCPYCRGKHEDVEACPLRPKRHAMVFAWLRPPLAQASYEFYHEACAPLVRVIPGCEVAQRKVDIRSLEQYATCTACGAMIQ